MSSEDTRELITTCANGLCFWSLGLQQHEWNVAKEAGWTGMQWEYFVSGKPAIVYRPSEPGYCLIGEYRLTGVRARDATP